MSHNLTMTDLFCGAGGSSTGAVAVGGIKVVLAANHWDRAIETHNANHPDTDHLQADISQTDPRYLPTTDILWASPECFTAGQLVTTTTGQVPIEQVRVGDLVLTHLGRWRPVVRVQSREQETVIVKGQGHPGIRTTANHKFWLRDSRQVWHNDIRQYRREYGQPGWAPIAGAVESKSLWATPVRVPSIPAPTLPAAFGADRLAALWLIGRWVADGSLTFGRNHEVLLACGFHQADELAEVLDATGVSWARSDKRTAAVFSIGDESARDWLHTHFGHGAAAKQIPPWALGLYTDERRALLDGYVSGDGYVNGARTYVSTVSRALAISARLLAESLGYRVCIGTDKRTTYTIEGRTGTALPQFILNWTNEPSTKRTPEAFEDGIHSWSRVRSVEPTGQTETVYNIEVADDHSYVLDGIVVANCTNHSRAKGRKAHKQPDLFGEVLPDEAAERSRATMWDVVRFAEAHHYRAVLVENVVEVVDWSSPWGIKGGLFDSWITAMHNMGYLHQIVSMNSMHAHAYGLPAPQSRDRVYIAFWRNGERKPDFEHMQRPYAHCPSCDEVVRSVQSWKRQGQRTGRYRSQYVYRCPKHSCKGQIVEPAWLPAASFIDWSNPGVRIGDRDKPLADKTMRRIQAGIDRYWSPLLVEHGGNPYDAADPKHPQFGNPDSYYRAWPTSDPSQTMHTRESKAVVSHPLLVPVEGREGKAATLANQAMRSQTTRNETGVAFPPLVSELRGGGSIGRPASEALSTVSAGGNHHALMLSYYSRDDAVRPAKEPVATVTTEPRHGVLSRPSVDINDVYFRMLEPSEIKQAMAFPAAYIMTGNRREQVRLSGNAVTPPAARDLVATVAAAITGEAVAA